MVKSFSLHILRRNLLILALMVSASFLAGGFAGNTVHATDVNNDSWNSLRILYTERTYTVEKNNGFITLTINSEMFRDRRYVTPIAPSSSEYSIVNLASPPCDNSMGSFQPVFRSTDGRDSALSMQTVYNLLNNASPSDMPDLRLSLLSTSTKSAECYEFAARYGERAAVDNEEERKVNVDDARTMSAYKSAGTILSTPLAGHQGAYSTEAVNYILKRDTSLSAYPAACANIGGSWNCGLESFQIFLGKCWASANNVHSGSPTSTNLESAVKASFSSCVSSQLYGNQSRARAIQDSIAGLTYQQIQDAISAADRQLIEDQADELRVQLPPSQTANLNTSTSTCDVEGIGWIVCPVVHFMGNIVDAAYSGIELLLNVPPLETNPITLNSGDDPLYNAWEIARNIANIVFIIVFIIVIYSQLSSIGISNYGVKRILPKLIVVAILVNISYWLCAVAVDASNIVGYSIKGLFENVNLGAGNSTGGWDGTAIDKDNIFSSIAGFVLVSGAVAGVAAFSYAGLAIFLPLLIAALVAVFTVFVLLTLRHALVILAIVVSPLAIVAYLLPNTEGLYKKWFSLFKTLLLLFPIIAAVFGGAQLAGTIVMRSSENILVDIAGAAMMIIPLFIVPTVLKATGGVLNRLGGFINNPNKGPIDSLRKSADRVKEDYTGRRAIRAARGGRVFGGGFQYRRKSRKEAISQGIKQQKSINEAQYVAETAEQNSSFRNQIAGGTSLFGKEISEATPEAMRNALANAINVQAKLTADQVSAAKAVIENANLPSAELQKVATGGSSGSLSGGDDIIRRAAIQLKLKKSTVEEAEDIIKSSGTMSESARQDVAETLVSSGLTSKAVHLSGKTLDNIAQGKVTTDADLDNAVMYHLNTGKISAEVQVNQDKIALGRIEKLTTSGVAPDGTTIDAEARANLITAAKQIIKDPRLKSRYSSKEAKKSIENISRL